MALSDDLARAGEAATAFCEAGERVAAVLPAEPAGGLRVYVCAFEDAAGARSWLALDADARPVASRNAVREAVSIAALCEIAEESAGGGELEELRARLASVRLTEAAPGIDVAEEAALSLERVLLPPPRLATPAYLDAIGAAARRLEQALREDVGSPFAAAMRAALPAVEELATEVERAHKTPLA